MDKGWVVLTTAPEQIVAELWAGFLRSQGIPCQIHPGDVAGFMGVTPFAVRLITRPNFLETAKNALDEMLSDTKTDLETP